MSLLYAQTQKSTLFWTFGSKFFSFKSSTMTQSPKPNPHAGTGVVAPYKDNNLSYLPPPAIALNSPALSNASKTTPV
jgi:hypothetical protein